MRTTKVAVVGMGTVGTGVVRLLIESHTRISRRAGQHLQVARVVVRDPRKQRTFAVDPQLVTHDIDAVIRDREIQIVAQLVGGIEPARTIMRRLLESGKDVVTANKALLAEHGRELFDHARSLGRSIAFEAAVAGGVPIIANISQCLSANQLVSLHGILNGTSNFIVSQMEERGAEYAAAVAEAQRLGFAEADPTLDVDGTDAAQKLAILAHLAFGSQIHWSDIPRVGINRLESVDLRYAQELGYRIKLLAVANLARTNQDLELHVSPTLVRRGTPLAEVRGANNAISIVGDAVGRVFFHGPGAGQMPTASAVVADMIDMAVGRTPITFRTLQLWSDAADGVPARDYSLASGRYYIRCTVRDEPGVLAKIAGILGHHNMSIASVIQHESEDPTGTVPLVVMTHTTTEGAMSAAIGAINQLDCVHGPTVRMRVMD